MRRSEKEIKDQKEIIEVLKAARICRIALHDEPFPYIVPLNFGVEDGNTLKFYFHCALEGRKLNLIKKNNKVAFEVDIETKVVSGEKACDWSMNYRSVLGEGEIFFVDNKDEKLQGLNVLMKQFISQDKYEYNEKLLDRTQVLRMEVATISAKQHGY